MNKARLLRVSSRAFPFVRLVRVVGFQMLLRVAYLTPNLPLINAVPQ